MPGELGLRVVPSAQFRDARGRFAKFDGKNLLVARLLRLGDETVAKLQDASPVRTGRLRAGWRASYQPTNARIEITDEAPYARYVVGGTRRMPPNAALRAVIAGLPADIHVALDEVKQAARRALRT